MLYLYLTDETKAGKYQFIAKKFYKCTLQEVQENLEKQHAQVVLGENRRWEIFNKIFTTVYLEDLETLHKCLVELEKYEVPYKLVEEVRSGEGDKDYYETDITRENIKGRLQAFKEREAYMTRPIVYTQTEEEYVQNLIESKRRGGSILPKELMTVSCFSELVSVIKEPHFYGFGQCITKKVWLPTKQYLVQLIETTKLKDIEVEMNQFLDRNIGWMESEIVEAFEEHRDQFMLGFKEANEWLDIIGSTYELSAYTSDLVKYYDAEYHDTQQNHLIKEGGWGNPPNDLIDEMKEKLADKQYYFDRECTQAQITAITEFVQVIFEEVCDEWFKIYERQIIKQPKNNKHTDLEELVENLQMDERKVMAEAVKCYCYLAGFYFLKSIDEGALSLVIYVEEEECDYNALSLCSSLAALYVEMASTLLA